MQMKSMIKYIKIKADKQWEEIFIFNFSHSESNTVYLRLINYKRFCYSLMTRIHAYSYQDYWLMVQSL